MATIVSLHAHPDDESIAVAGTLARATAAGHRVVLVFATRGELGEPVPGVLADGEQLTLRRTAECYASAAALGVERVEFLGYTDSGMMGEATNDLPWCFWQADVDQAAHRLRAILDEEQPDVLTIYDDNGGYGHPDHIQVHRVGHRAAELAGSPYVVESTINRTAIERGLAERGLGDRGPDLDANPDFGKPESVITHRVDATAVIAEKRKAMEAHSSQIAPDHFLLAMPDDIYTAAMGVEWYIVDPQQPAEAPAVFTELFEPLR